MDRESLFEVAENIVARRQGTLDEFILGIHRLKPAFQQTLTRRDHLDDASLARRQIVLDGADDGRGFHAHQEMVEEALLRALEAGLGRGACQLAGLSGGGSESRLRGHRGLDRDRRGSRGAHRAHVGGAGRRARTQAANHLIFTHRANGIRLQQPLADGAGEKLCRTRRVEHKLVVVVEKLEIIMMQPAGERAEDHELDLEQIQLRYMRALYKAIRAIDRRLTRDNRRLKFLKNGTLASDKLLSQITVLAKDRNEHWRSLAKQSALFIEQYTETQSSQSVRYDGEVRYYKILAHQALGNEQHVQREVDRQGC